MSIQPEILRKKYTKFLRDGRVLLTGHSHQAWPDCAELGVIEAYEDAAELVDDKWGKAFEKAECVRGAIAAYCGSESARVALGQNTHELFVRFLSALPQSRTHVVATKGEFHSVRRQLVAMQPRGLNVTWVDVQPVDTLCERLMHAATDQTAAIICSSVLFETATIVPRIDALVADALAQSIEVFLDGYHAFMALPCDFSDTTRRHAFLSGGGYKYAQWGEGVCWMTIPEHFAGVPTFTGWFSDFKNLDRMSHGKIGYGERPADVFAGSTYDPTSHYRAARVIDFFKKEGLTIERLRALSTRQTDHLIKILGPVGLVSPIEAEKRGGFVTYRVEAAAELVSSLRARGIYADARGSHIRFGPAPYTSFDALDCAGSIIAEIMRPLK